MSYRNDNLRTVISRYISILNTQNALSLDKVAEIIVSMMSDLEGFIEEDMLKTASAIAEIESKIAPLELKLRYVDGEILGQVVRYVVGESLAKPGGLPLDIERLMISSHNVEEGIRNLSSEMLRMSERVEALERLEHNIGWAAVFRKTPLLVLFVAITVVGAIALILRLATL